MQKQLDHRIITTTGHPARCVQATVDLGWELRQVVRGLVDQHGRWQEIGYTFFFVRPAAEGRPRVSAAHARDIAESVEFEEIELGLAGGSDVLATIEAMA